jgi:hypothetical protein
MRRLGLPLALVLLAGCLAGTKLPRQTAAEPRLPDRDRVAAVLAGEKLTLDTIISAPPGCPEEGRRLESALVEAGAHVGADGKLHARDGREIYFYYQGPGRGTPPANYDEELRAEHEKQRQLAERYYLIFIETNPGYIPC